MYIYYGQKHMNFISKTHQRTLDYIDKEKILMNYKKYMVISKICQKENLKLFGLERKGVVRASWGLALIYMNNDNRWKQV